MVFKKRSLLLFSILILLGLNNTVRATHIRAGEIIAIRQDFGGCGPAYYVFKIIGYTDTSSDVEFGGGYIDFGLKGIPPLKIDTKFPVVTQLGDGVAVTIFETDPVYYPDGHKYTISFREMNRNADVVNMDNSVNTPFCIQTQISVSSYYGCNDSPVLTAPPVDVAAKGVAFFHNPGAYDPDGDSLSYRIQVCKQDTNISVANYEYPDVHDKRVYGSAAVKEDGDSPATFTLNPTNGDLVWDAPAGVGKYNIAFQVVEWRKVDGEFVEIGYVTRDMQIVVEETYNERPELTIPDDTCVAAGPNNAPRNLHALITADDFNEGEGEGEGMVKILAFGGPMALTAAQSRARITPDSTYQEVIAEVEFDWQVICGHVRDRYYDVTFKATDDGTFEHGANGRSMSPMHGGGKGPKLSDFKTWRISVIGPKPNGLTVQPQSGRQFQLNWNTYSCPNASEMQIWRRVDEFEFNPEACESGIPDNGGYELIGTVPIGTKSFLDTNGGKGLDFGANYCYRLVAIFPAPEGGISYASDEICAIMEASGPVITNVSIDPFYTSDTVGRIFVGWLAPLVIDETILPSPYTYKVMRAEGFEGELDLTQVAITQDTFLIDSLLNTLDKVYNYRIYLYASNQNASSEEPSIISATASSVRLGSDEAFQRIDLSWEANVPWTNQSASFPKHYIYRDHVTSDHYQIALIDSVDVVEGGFTYTDVGQFNGLTLSNDSIYCYYISAFGTYGNPDLPIGALINNSQRICVQPNDTVPPCSPLSINVSAPDGLSCRDFTISQFCGFKDFSNVISWTRPVGEACDDDIRDFNIYYSETGFEGTYQLLATNIRDTFYIDSNLPSFARCYKISSVDRSDNESQLSEAICNDNCPYILFPNAFTPNGDAYNNTFRPFSDNNSVGQFDVANCPRFVESIKIRIYNRWGVEVFNYESGGENSILVDWNGYDKTGKRLSAGVYYYVADVKFTMLNPAGEVRKYKGAIHLFY